MQHIEQLALVLVHALDLHVEQAVGVDDDAGLLGNAFGQAPLVLRLGQA